MYLVGGFFINVSNQIKNVSVKPTKLGLCPENRRITNAHIKTNLCNLVNRFG